jgi:hypothetical protein
MAYKYFPRETLLDYLKAPNLYLIKREVIAINKWERVTEVIFKIDDKLYQTHYTQGLTNGDKEYGPWDDEPSVRCLEVVPVQVCSTRYVPAGRTLDL